MTRTTITLPSPDVQVLNGGEPMWIVGAFEIRIDRWPGDVGNCVYSDIDEDGAALVLTPAEARAFGAALIAASYQAEQPTTLGDKGV